jgi:hypothetical protein
VAAEAAAARDDVQALLGVDFDLVIHVISVKKERDTAPAGAVSRRVLKRFLRSER